MKKYMTEGFVKNEEEDKVYLLKKALYRLKQVSRTWYNIIDDYLLRHRFKKKKKLFEVALYVKHWDNDVLMFSFYVDDVLLIGNNVWLV